MSYFQPYFRPIHSRLFRALTDAGVGGDIRFAVTGAYTAVIGDSIDQGVSANPWFNLACMLSGQRMRVYVNSGIGGNKTADMLARIDADILALSPLPDVCVIGGGTNDFGSADTPAATRANIEAMVGKLRTAGVVPILRNVPPTNAAGLGAFNTVALRRAGVVAHNEWLAGYAAAEGIHVFDVFTPLADGDALAAIYDLDAVHPNQAGHFVVAQAAAANLPGYLSNAARPYLIEAADSVNLVPNGLFLTPTASVASGWSRTGAGSSLNEPYTFGNTQSVITDGTAQGVLQMFPRALTPAGVAYEFSAVVQVGAGVKPSFRFNFTTGTGSTVGSAIFPLSNSYRGQSSDELVLFVRAVAPATAVEATAFAINDAGGSAGSIKISRASIRVSPR